ncbi:hypothetical protein JA1_000687 [Spathaspora sp. JA1]|nr:hypothetical protein JA1_000687 [Spathaspora sp. JA1]
MELDLNRVELERIQTSWADIPSKKRFFAMLYSNLIIENSQVSKIFHNDDDLIEEHSSIFGDLFEYVVIHLRNISLIEEFVVGFINDNPQFCQLSCKYLDTMGSAMLDTFKQVLGDGFDKDMELAWIKTYVFVANYILKLTNVEDDNESFASVLSESTEPLNINKDSSTPTTPSNPTSDDQDDSVETNLPDADTINTIKFLLSSNSKYRGFRRSSVIPDDTPITVKVPQSKVFSKAEGNMSCSLKSTLHSRVNSVLSVEDNFDPRPKSRLPKPPSFISIKSSQSTMNESFVSADDSLSGDSSDEYEENNQINEHNDEFVTPKSDSAASSVQSSSSLLQRLREKKMEQKESDCSDSEYEDVDNKFKQPITSRLNQYERQLDRPYSDKVENNNSKPFDPRRKTMSRLDQFAKELSPKVVKEQESPEFKPPVGIPQRSPARLATRSVSPECFGLKGLAPIVEVEDKLNKSSTNDTSSSRTSSLSLRGSESGSSMSSANEVYNPYTKNISMVASNRIPHSSLDKLRFSSSTSSLVESSKSNRVSLGFMRSSYILKKEIEEIGFNRPENIVNSNVNRSLDSIIDPAAFTAPPTITETESICSIEGESESRSFMNNSFVGSTDEKESLRRYDPGPAKSSFRRRLSSMFSATSKPRSQRLRGQSSSSLTVNPREHSLTRSTHQPSTTSLFSSKSQFEIPKNPYSGTVITEFRDDCGSINSAETRDSSLSGFSFMKKGEKGAVAYTLPSVRHTKRGNKYNVTKTAYNIF